MKKVVCIGHASYDLTLPFDGYPVENTKYRVQDMTECGGGPASNAAYLLGKWGMDTTFIGMVGNDIYANRIIDEFKTVNVDTKYIEKDLNSETDISFIIVNKQNGSRTVLSHHPSDMVLKNKYDMPADVILVDGQELQASLDMLEANPNAISVIDAGTLKESTRILGKKVNYLVCSKNFAEDFAGITIDLNNPSTITSVYQKMSAEFKNTIIITLEDKGCLYVKDDKIHLMPSIKVKPVDTTGAGDIFHGAFTYCVANEFDLEKSLKIANITGALSVTRLGGRNSVFTLDDVMKAYEENC